MVEIDNDEAGTTEMAKIMPQYTGELGPLAGLPFSQQIGQQGLFAGFPDTIAGLGPTVPTLPHLESAPMGPPPAAQIPAPIVIPYPSVQLGPVSDAPHVPIGD